MLVYDNLKLEFEIGEFVNLHLISVLVYFSREHNENFGAIYHNLV